MRRRVRGGLLVVAALVGLGVRSEISAPPVSADGGAPIVTLSGTPPLAEQAGTRVAWNLAPVLDQIAVDPVTVTLTVLGGTAELGTDYILPPTLDLTGTDRGDLEIEVLDDDIAEPDETIDLLITVTGGTILDGIDVQLRTLTIWDNEGSGTGVALIEESPVAGNGFLEGNVGSGNRAVVRFRTQSIRPVGDYTATFQIVGASGDIALGADESFQVGCTDCAGEVINFDVGATIIGDDISELAEKVFFVRLVAVTGDLVIDPDRSSVRIVIIDDDTPLGTVIGTNLLDDADQLVPLVTKEGNATDVTFTGGPEVPSDVEVATMELVPGTSSVSDFGQTSFIATCTRLEPTDANCDARNQLLPLWDIEPEGNETATLVATAKPGYVFANGLTVLNVPVTIADGGPQLSITRRQPGLVAEGETGLATVWFDVALSAPLTEVVEVSYASLDGTAVAPDDYTTRTSSVVIAPGQLSTEFGLAVVGDLRVEADETFYVNAEVVRGPSEMMFITPSHEITIDDDDVYPTVSAASARIVERSSGQWAVSTVITLNAAPFEPVTVDYATQSVTALAGLDFVDTFGTATFGVGQRLFTVTVPIVGDTVPEGTEGFDLALSNAVASVIDPVPGTITIEDDDSGNPVVSAASMSVNENGSVANVAVSLSVAPTTAVTVDYTTGNGTAVAGRDYRSKSGTLVFAPGTQSLNVGVTILNDSRIETQEQFTLTLRNAVGVALAPNAVATVDIVDDDSPTPSVRASMSPVSITEGDGVGGIGTATVTLASARTQATTIEVRSNAATATEGSDYPAIVGTITIPAGQTSGSLPISVLGDDVVETDETFRLVLSAPNDPQLRIQTSNVAVTIVDDDTAQVSIRQVDADPLLERSSGTRTVRYIISVPTGAVAYNTIIGVSTANGTARSRSDYFAVNTRVTLRPGITEQEVTVRIRGDVQVEMDETFTINLTSRDGALVMPAPLVTTIVNDD